MEDFRWSEETLANLRPNRRRTPDTKWALPRHNRGQPFLRGPIPLDWLLRTIPLGRKALNVSLALWWLAGMNRSCPVRLTAQTLSQFGVTSEGANEILIRMEQAGLVRVKRRRGKGPEVVLLETPLKSEENSS